MTDRDINDSEWIAAWIARQRESLAQSAQGAAYEGATQDFGRHWAEAGQAFFDGLRRVATSGAGAEPGAHLDPFNVGDALLGAWTNATLLQSSAAEQAAELLRRLPPIGLAREQTEAWRELAAAHAECKRLEHELRAVLAKVQLAALDLLEKRVREREPAQRIESFRELYDLWVECGEQAYGKLAHSVAYSKLQAELGNASMRLRTRLQKVLEYWLKQFDLPTRSELNSLHRQVRELRLQVEAMNRTRAPAAASAKSARKSAKRKSKARIR